ncbi:hypothetical protein AX16_002554 [Volvariella volvacea WC 439]|nr:hypothetical protein AX16_002554 [Volvariella volvacea WC 439]
MASYFRSFFGGQSTNTTGNNAQKTHTHSQSAPTAPPPDMKSKLSYIYAPPSATPSSSSSGSRSTRENRHPSRAPANASSLQHSATYESGSVRSKGKRPAYYPTAGVPAQQNPQMPLYTSSAHNARDGYQPYQIYAPAVPYGSVRSTSSKTASVPPVTKPTRPHATRTSSSGSVPRSDFRPEPRPVLKQKQSRPSGVRANSKDHVSFQNPHKPTALHMHPLFAYSRLHHAPISYDICYAPTSQYIVDRSTRSPIPSHMLLQPATDPPTYSELTLKCEKLPWPVVVVPSSSSNDATASLEFATAGSRSNLHAGFVTNLDVLTAVHQTLRTRITPKEWEELGNGSRSQRKVTRAYEKRCTKMDGGWTSGVRRLDYLGGKTRLVGIETDKSAGASGVGKLVFSKV